MVTGDKLVLFNLDENKICSDLFVYLQKMLNEDIALYADNYDKGQGHLMKILTDEKQM